MPLHCSVLISMVKQNNLYVKGKPVDMSDFFPYATGVDSGLTHVCAVVQNYQGEIGFAARGCSERRHYLCQYSKFGRKITTSYCTLKGEITIAKVTV